MSDDLRSKPAAGKGAILGGLLAHESFTAMGQRSQGQDLSKYPPFIQPQAPATSPREEPGEVAGGPKTAEKTPRRKAKGASTLPVLGGKREVRAYPVTEDELENLGVLSLAAAATFSVASFLGAFWLSVNTSIAMATGAKPEIVSYWQGLSTAAGIASLALFSVGGYLVYRGHTKVSKIKSGTAHE